MGMVFHVCEQEAPVLHLEVPVPRLGLGRLQVEVNADETATTV